MPDVDVPEPVLSQYRQARDAERDTDEQDVLPEPPADSPAEAAARLAAQDPRAADEPTAEN
jgi:hypothetical protein